MKQEKFDFTINDIVTNAQRLFLQYGYKKTSIEDIAEATNRAKSTIYHFFSSKEQIFDAVVSYEMQEMRKSVKEKIDCKQKSSEKILAYLDQLALELSNRLTLLSIITNEIKDKTAGKNEYLKIVEFENIFLTQLFLEGVESQEFTNISREDIPLLAEVILSAFFGIIGYMINTDNRHDITKLSRLLKNIAPQFFC